MPEISLVLTKEDLLKLAHDRATIGKVVNAYELAYALNFTRKPLEALTQVEFEALHEFDKKQRQNLGIA